MDRALLEYRIRGVATNLAFLHNDHQRAAIYRKRLYDALHRRNAGSLFDFKRRKDRATKLLTWVADVTVNGHPETKGRAKPPATARAPVAPQFPDVAIADGTRQLFDAARAQGIRRMDAGRAARARHRHHNARRASVAARNAHAHQRHRRRGRSLRQRPAAAVVAGMLGRRHFRRRHAVPVGRPVGAPRAGAGTRAKPVDPDASAWRERASATPIIPTMW